VGSRAGGGAGGRRTWVEPPSTDRYKVTGQGTRPARLAGHRTRDPAGSRTFEAKFPSM